MQRIDFAAMRTKLENSWIAAEHAKTACDCPITRRWRLLLLLLLE